MRFVHGFLLALWLIVSSSFGQDASADTFHNLPAGRALEESHLGLPGKGHQPVAAAADSVDTIAAKEPENIAQQSDSVEVSGLGGVTQKPSAFSLRLFSLAQYDSVLSLLPSSDSIRKANRILSVALDTITDEIVLVTLSESGEPRLQRFSPDTFVRSPLSPDQKPVKLVQDGRTWFIISTTLKSAFVYPFAYSSAFDSLDGRVVAGLSLLSVGGTLYGGFAFTRGMELGYGKVALMNYGASLGFIYPLQLSVLLRNATHIDDKYKVTDPYYPEEHYIYYNGPTTSDKIRAWTSVVTFPLGIYAGSKLRVADNDDFGKVSVMTYFSQSALGLSYIVPLYAYQPGFPGDDRRYLTTASAISLAAMPAAFYGGYALVKDREVSSGRGALLYVTGAMGTATGALIPSLFEPDFSNLANQRIYASAALAGYGLGTAFGLKYHPEEQYTFWQSVFMGASAVGGALIGVAVPLVLQTDFNDAHQAYTLAGIAGGWTGLLLGERLSHELFEKAPQDKPSSSSRAYLNLPVVSALPHFFASRGNRAGRAERTTVYPLAEFGLAF